VLFLKLGDVLWREPGRTPLLPPANVHVADAPGPHVLPKRAFSYAKRVGRLPGLEKTLGNRRTSAGLRDGITVSQRDDGIWPDEIAVKQSAQLRHSDHRPEALGDGPFQRIAQHSLNAGMHRRISKFEGGAPKVGPALERRAA